MVLKNPIKKISGRYTKEMIRKGLISEEIVEQLSSFDPTPQKKYLDWMTKIYIQNSPDLDELRNYIEEFDQISHRGNPETSDIYRFKDFESFKNFMEEQRHREFFSVSDLENAYEVVADNDKLFIAVPYTQEASRKLGYKYFVNREKGECAWCTTHGNPSFYRSRRVNLKQTLYYCHVKDPEFQSFLEKNINKEQAKKFDLENFAIVVQPDAQIEIYDNFNNLLPRSQSKILLNIVEQYI